MGKIKEAAVKEIETNIFINMANITYSDIDQDLKLAKLKVYARLIDFLESDEFN